MPPETSVLLPVCELGNVQEEESGDGVFLCCC